GDVTINDANTGANNTALMIDAHTVRLPNDITVTDLGSGTTTIGATANATFAFYQGAIETSKNLTLQGDAIDLTMFKGGITSPNDSDLTVTTLAGGGNRVTFGGSN